MAEYVSIPTQTDPDGAAQDSYDYLESKVPTWRPNDGQLDTWLIAAVARQIATLGDTMTDVQANIFRYFGAFLFGIPPLEATSAFAKSKWTMVDALGHTVPLGTAIAVPAPDGQLVPFETTEEVIIPPGSTTANIPIAAIEAGSEGTGLGTAGTVCSLLDQLNFLAIVNGVVLNETTSGGQDAEEDQVYLSRLVAQLRLMAPRPILPNDFAEIARTVAGVSRVLAINGYDPANGLFTNERTVAIACVDSEGVECSPTIKTAVETLLLSKREVNFIIKMIAITYTEIGVEWEVKKWPEWNAADVKNRIEEALKNFLSPKNWGQPPFGDTTLWYVRSEVKLKDVIAVIGAVDGVEDVLKVKTKSGAGAYAEADITLAGVAQLPKVGLVNAGTVV